MHNYHSIFNIAILTLLLSTTAVAANIDITVEPAIGDNGDLSGMVITLEPVNNQVGRDILPKKQTTQIKQQGRQFQPFIQVASTNQRVDFPNADPVAHHVYSFSKPNSFELPLYHKNNDAQHTFKQPGTVVLGCNIHDWMLSYLFITDAPFYGQVQNKRLQLNDIPSGHYQLKLWHPGMPSEEPTQEIKVTDDTSSFSIQLRQKLNNIQQPSAPSDDFDEDGDY